MEAELNNLRPLSYMGEDAFRTIDRVKTLGSMLGALVEDMEVMPGVDQRWVKIGKTDLQKGIMGLVRSVANSGTF